MSPLPLLWALVPARPPFARVRLLPPAALLAAEPRFDLEALLDLEAPERLEPLAFVAFPRVELLSPALARAVVRLAAGFLAAGCPALPPEADRPAADPPFFALPDREGPLPRFP